MEGRGLLRGSDMMREYVVGSAMCRVCHRIGCSMRLLWKLSASKQLRTAPLARRLTSRPLTSAANSASRFSASAAAASAAARLRPCAACSSRSLSASTCIRATGHARMRHIQIIPFCLRLRSSHHAAGLGERAHPRASTHSNIHTAAPTAKSSKRSRYTPSPPPPHTRPLSPVRTFLITSVHSLRRATSRLVRSSSAASRAASSASRPLSFS